MSEAMVTAGQYSVAVPLAVGLWRSDKMPLHFRWLVALLGLWLVTETVLYLMRHAGLQNLWVSYVLSVGELILIMPLFAKLVSGVPVRWLCVGGVVITAVEFVLGGAANSISLLYECMLVVVLCLLALRQMVNGSLPWKYAWIVAALLLLFMGSAVYYTSFLRPDNMELLHKLSDAHTVLLFVSYSILTIGLWKL
jgi:hypothetical protein